MVPFGSVAAPEQANEYIREPESFKQGKVLGASLLARFASLPLLLLSTTRHIKRLKEEGRVNTRRQGYAFFF